MTAIEALGLSKSGLENAKIKEPEAKAKVIVAHALDIEFSDILNFGKAADEAYYNIMRMTKRCILGEPVEYVTGKAYFRHVTLDVSKDVLIPRRETELVAQQAIDLIKQNKFSTAIDICTGSGCIAISLAAETGIFADACDISEKALDIAKSNARKNGAAKKTNFFVSDMFKSVRNTYDIIVSNPPYVSQGEYEKLDRSVKQYEPKNALVAGDGLIFYREIAANSIRYLNSKGAIVLEIGAAQASKVMDMLKQNGFCGVECKKDYEGRDRIVYARKE